MNKPVALLLAALCPIALASACSSKEAAQDPGKADCDNLDTTACMFPFPSDFFRKTGGPYGQAFQLDFGKNLPINTQTDFQIDGSAFADHDGFPIYPQVAFALEGATLTGVPSHANIDDSLKADAKVIVIDTESGELQPHWVEFDYLSAEQGAKIIELRLANVLKHSHRYIIAVRNLVDVQGKPVAATPGFRALRDKSSTALLGIEERRARFESEIFPALEKAGVKRSELQLAWDFTTTSEEAATSRIRGMRDELYNRIGDDGPEYTITDSQKNPDGDAGYIDTILTGIAKVPSFMLPAEPSKPRKLRLNDKGLAVVDGFEDVPFHVQIPKITRTSSTKAGVVQYGHGFLGDDGEANNDWLRKFANDRNFLILSSNMQGMDNSAGILWFIALPRDMTNVARLGDEPLQGIMNHLALERMMKGRFTKDPTMQKDAAPIYDPSQIFYHGNSQGGTQGFVVTAMSRDLKRAALGEPGMSVAYVLARARNWRDIVSSIQPKYPNPYDLASIEALVAVGWDKGDGSNLAVYNSMTPPPDGTPKTLLLHVGIEDAQVNNDVTHLLARSVNATLVKPKTRDVWHLPETDGPIIGRNVMVEFDYGVPIHPNSNQPALAETDTHDKPKKSLIAQEQMWHFFQTGEIINTCSDTCNPD